MQYLAQNRGQTISREEGNIIAEGRLEKFYQEVCLLKQPFVKDESQTIADLLKSTIAAIGENVIIRRFARWELGEALDK